MATQNRQVLLASRPQGPVTEENFRIVEAPVAAPAAGEVLVKNEWLSLDPYMRGRMSEAKSYVPPAPIGEVMVGQTVGEVIESQNPRFKPGDKVLTQLGWQLYGVAKSSELTPIDVKRAPGSYYLGLLGMPGITAWFGLSEIGQPKAGETVVVSAASGAVGSVVGQIARIKGCRAVGIAGSSEKCDYVVKDLGFDACVNYKAQELFPALKEACPRGVDVYFDNVGGPVLAAGGAGGHAEVPRGRRRGPRRRPGRADRPARRQELRQAAGQGLERSDPLSLRWSPEEAAGEDRPAARTPHAVKLDRGTLPRRV